MGYRAPKLLWIGKPVFLSLIPRLEWCEVCRGVWGLERFKCQRVKFNKSSAITDLFQMWRLNERRMHINPDNNVLMRINKRAATASLLYIKRFCAAQSWLQQENGLVLPESRGELLGVWDRKGGVDQKARMWRIRTNTASQIYIHKSTRVNLCCVFSLDLCERRLCGVRMWFTKAALHYAVSDWVCFPDLFCVWKAKFTVQFWRISV